MPVSKTVGLGSNPSTPVLTWRVRLIGMATVLKTVVFLTAHESSTPSPSVILLGYFARLFC